VPPWMWLYNVAGAGNLLEGYPAPARALVFRNRVMQYPGTDYLSINGLILFAAGVVNVGDEIAIVNLDGGYGA
jgi:hypothetical protein